MNHVNVLFFFEKNGRLLSIIIIIITSQQNIIYATHLIYNNYKYLGIVADLSRSG